MSDDATPQGSTDGQGAAAGTRPSPSVDASLDQRIQGVVARLAALAPERRSLRPRALHRVSHRSLVIIATTVLALIAVRTLVPPAATYALEPIGQTLIMPSPPRDLTITLDGQRATAPGKGSIQMVSLTESSPPRYRWWLLRFRPWVGVQPTAAAPPQERLAAAATAHEVGIAAGTQLAAQPSRQLSLARPADTGGWSAGLALAVNVYSILSGEDLAKGRHIVIAGDVSPAGTVDQVPYTAQAGKAALDAGVDLLLVPTGNGHTARRYAEGLAVHEVASAREAVEYLRTT